MSSSEPILTPAALKARLPASPEVQAMVTAARAEIRRVLSGEDPRLLIVVGPCSIHDVAAAQVYAEHLLEAQARFEGRLLLVMRAYVQKPRSRLGWKGLISDPRMDGSFALNEGLIAARRLLLTLAKLGVPAGTEWVDLFIHAYLADLIAWGAIGARTVESQMHRELASSSPAPTAFKNNTLGQTQGAIEAVLVARSPHTFLGLGQDGALALQHSEGNPDAHLVLRGGRGGANHNTAAVEAIAQSLRDAGLPVQLLIDLSHGNSQGDASAQLRVGREVAEQLEAGQGAIRGVMIESNLVGGRQAPGPLEGLVFGQSVTDACLAWEETEPLLALLADAALARQRRG